MTARNAADRVTGGKIIPMPGGGGESLEPIHEKRLISANGDPYGRGLSRNLTNKINTLSGAE